MLRILVFVADFIVKYTQDLMEGQPMITACLYDNDHNFLGTVNIPKFPTIPSVIVRGLRVFVLYAQINGTPEYQEQFAYFAPVAPLFLW